MRHFKLICALGLLLHALPAQSEAAGVPWFEDVPRSDYYHDVTPASQAALEEAYLLWFRDHEDGAITAFYELQRESWQEQDVILAASKPDLGWGVWGYRPDDEQNMFLQAPHRFYDLDTAVIGEMGWQAGLAGLFMMNSVHRNAGQQQEPMVNSDISNARRSALLAASEAWLAVNPHGIIVQLHGYAKSKRETPQGQHADIILSHGTKERFLTDTRLHHIQDCLTRLLDVQVLRYPDEVGELGGTQNNVAKALASWGKSEQFIHVEMSRAVRETLVNDPTKTQQALQCIAGAGSA